MMGLVEEEELDPQGQGHLAERRMDAGARELRVGQTGDERGQLGPLGAVAESNEANNSASLTTTVY